MSDAQHADWTAIVPVKHTARGKSRLRASPRLTRAIAFDTLDAIAAAVARVVVVTDDPDVARHARELGADVVAEPAHHDDVDDVEGGLNAAVAAGLGTVERGPVAVVHADLPALAPDALVALLDEAAAEEFAALPDLDGSGTTILTARTPRALRPSFGAGSFARHRAAGAAALTAPPALRHDVDTAAQLNALAADSTATLGARTRRALPDQE